MDIGFILKKFITFFVEPFGLVFTLLVIGLYFLYLRKESYAKLFLSFGVSLLFLFSYPPFSNYLVKNLEDRYPKYDLKQKVRYIHVLGSGHNVDRDQPLSSQISSAGVKRVLEGVILHKQMVGSKLIFTGYEGDTNISNAQMNANLAVALGVDKDDIIINPKPKDTAQEAKFTKTLVGDEPFVLVTSATHMPRSMGLFKALGLNPIPAPTNFYKREFKGYIVAPDVGTFEVSGIAVHEYIGILWNKINGIIRNEKNSNN